MVAIIFFYKKRLDYLSHRCLPTTLFFCDSYQNPESNFAFDKPGKMKLGGDAGHDQKLASPPSFIHVPNEPQTYAIKP